MVEKTKEPAQPVVGKPRVNKMNMRRENLKNLLSCHEKNNLRPSANTLRNLMHKNDKQVAGDARSSLNLMRVIFQPDLTREITQLLERYTSGTFQPAFVNLEKNGQKVSDEVMKELYANILDEAKKEILKSTIKIEPEEMEQQITQGSVMRQLVQSDEGYHHFYAQPVQPLQQIQPQTMNQQRTDYPVAVDVKPILPTPEDMARWKPERFNNHTQFINAQTVAMLLQTTEHQLLNQQCINMFRYQCEAGDIAKLIEDCRLTRGTTNCILVTVEDVKSAFGSGTDHLQLQNYSFTLTEQMLANLHKYAKQYFMRLAQKEYSARMNQPQVWGHHQI